MAGVTVKDAVVFVTGANRGIGRAIAEEAVARGAKRVYAAARDPSGVQDMVEKNPDVVVPIELDVTNGEQIEKAAADAKDVQ
ncbi:MAG: SDR family NAD(P)-dependent oxidoreductase, partial [Gammaproteobacteria bacterium]|nr:SDR family NAD(P)-dependent oxidoreductase [Gammaproteobacteria bacterium]